MERVRQNMSKKKSMTIFSQSVCAKLMLRGYKLQGMKPDRKYPERNVFFFENTEKARNDLAEIVKDCKNQ